MAATTSPAISPSACRPAAPEAERIKNLYGGTQFRTCDDSTRIEVPLIGDQAELPTGEVPRTRVTEIVRARVEEILQLRAGAPRRAARAPGRPAAALGRAHRRRQPARRHRASWSRRCSACRSAAAGRRRSAGRAGAEESPCCATAAGAVGLTLGDDGGLGWSQQVEVSMLSGRLARLGEWFKQNF